MSASFLQVLQFTQQEYMQLAHKALPLWISLLSSAERAQRGSTEDVPLPLDCMVPLMDLAGERTTSHADKTCGQPSTPQSQSEFKFRDGHLLSDICQPQDVALEP